MPKLLPPPDWVVPPLTIVVAALPRSGSNLLGELMAGTGLLGNPLEAFGVDSISPDFPTRAMSTSERLKLVVEMGRTPNGVAAVKMFPDHFTEIEDEVRLSDWFGTPAWVWLRRRDQLAQAISTVVASQSRSFMSERAPLHEPVYSGDRLLLELERVARRDSRWQAYFARTGIRPIEVVYEDLERDPLGTMQAIGRHVGIDVPVDAFRPATRFQRQRTGLNEEWRSRFVAEYGDPDRLMWSSPKRAPRASRPPSPWVRAKRRVRRMLGQPR